MYCRHGPTESRLRENLDIPQYSNQQITWCSSHHHLTKRSPGSPLVVPSRSVLPVITVKIWDVPIAEMAEAPTKTPAAPASLAELHLL